jgi:hypothetical protein
VAYDKETQMNLTKQLPDYAKDLVYDAVSDAYEKTDDQQQLWQTVTNFMDNANARAKRLGLATMTFSEARQILAELEMSLKQRHDEEGRVI